MKDQRQARSLYRQMRLTVTQERSGMLAYSIYAKGLNDRWDEHQCIVRDVVDVGSFPLHSTEDVVAALVIVLEEQFLPGGRT
jgi:hypothetical protein